MSGPHNAKKQPRSRYREDNCQTMPSVQYRNNQTNKQTDFERILMIIVTG